MRRAIVLAWCVLSGGAVAQEGPVRVIVQPGQGQPGKVQPGKQVIQMPPSVAPANEALAAELKRLHRRDQGVRARIPMLGAEQGLPLPEVFLDEWNRVDAENMAALRRIVDEHGWPGVSLAGTEGAMTAFLIVQHADLETQREFLPKLEGAAEAGEMPRAQLAYLIDRVRIREGKPQVYGTQLGIDEHGNVVAENLGEPEGVDARRAEVGLPPLEMYLSMAAQGRPKAEGGAAPTEPALRAELKAVQAAYRDIGPGRFEGGVTRDEATWPAEVRAARGAARERARALVERALSDGYPTATRVGEDGTRAMFHLVAALDLEMQERALEALEDAVATGDGSRAHLAWLTDTVRVGRGEEQVYGTRFVRSADGTVVAQPIKDEAGVDERRAAAGLPPMAEVLAALNGDVEDGPGSQRIIVK